VEITLVGVALVLALGLGVYVFRLKAREKEYSKRFYRLDSRVMGTELGASER
jgi:hypothetical protein